MLFHNDVVPEASEKNKISKVALWVYYLGGAYLYPCCAVVDAHQSCQQHSLAPQPPWPGLAFQKPLEKYWAAVLGGRLHWGRWCFLGLERSVHPLNSVRTLFEILRGALILNCLFTG